MSAAPAWLENVVIEGLQALKAASFEGAPAHDSITLTLDVWLGAMTRWPIVWDRERDEPRVREAFRVLFGTVKKWPQPVQLREVMPPRAPLAALPPPIRREVSAEVRAHIDSIVNRRRRAPGEIGAHQLLAKLQQHVGAANGIGARALAVALNTNERHVRHLVTELIIDQGVALCGTPSTGYFVAETEAEIEATVDMHRHRALHELAKASRLAKKPLQEIAGQLLLKT